MVVRLLHSSRLLRHVHSVNGGSYSGCALSSGARLVGMERFGDDMRIGGDEGAIIDGKAGAAKDEGRISQLLKGPHGDDGRPA